MAPPSEGKALRVQLKLIFVHLGLGHNRNVDLHVEFLARYFEGNVSLEVDAQGNAVLHARRESGDECEVVN